MNGVNNNLILEETGVPPKLAPKAKMNPAWLILGGLATIAGGVTLFWFNPSRYGFYPPCLFHSLTGLDCPGCGGTRALYQLLHGHIETAFRLNALLVALLPFVAWRGIRIATARFRRQPMVQPITPTWLWVFFALTVAFGILRNLPGLTWFAP
jgi:Protein of unknown function (DUF2752)